MSKKIMLLALGAVSVLMLALPAMSSAKIPLHLNSVPAGAKTITGTPGASLGTANGTTTICNGFSGTATFTSTTGGTMELTFGPHCVAAGTTCTSHVPAAPSGTITTTPLAFELVTLAGKQPGVLVTAPSGVFAHFTCFGGLINVTVEAHGGVLGTITEPVCGGTSNKATISFESVPEKHGLQKHTTLENTPLVEYSLTKGGETAAQDAHGTLDLGTSHTLNCT
jgi:hypothetical protein